jgi:hypothetical protein
MRPFKPYLHLASLSTFIVILLVISSCGSSTQPAISKPSPRSTVIQNPTATPLPVRTMRVNVGGYQLYIRCIGQGTPTVLFEEGLGDDVSTHPEQAKRLAAALGPAFITQARQSFPVEGMTYDDLLAIQAQVEAVKNQFPDVPLIVLVRSRFNPGPTWTANQLRQAWVSLQIDLSKRSSRGKLVIAENSSHDIPNDRLDLVIQSIHKVVQESQHA